MDLHESGTPQEITLSREMAFWWASLNKYGETITEFLNNFEPWLKFVTFFHGDCLLYGINILVLLFR